MKILKSNKLEKISIIVLGILLVVALYYHWVLFVAQN